MYGLIWGPPPCAFSCVNTPVHDKHDSLGLSWLKEGQPVCCLHNHITPLEILSQALHLRPWQAVLTVQNVSAHHQTLTTVSICINCTVGV